MTPDPVELTIVQTEQTARVCLAYDKDSVIKYKDNSLINLGIQQSLPLLRDRYGHRLYIINGHSIERTAQLAKVILDLDLL